MILRPIHAQVSTLLVAHGLSSVLAMLRLPEPVLIVTLQRHDLAVLKALSLSLTSSLNDHVVRLDRW